jgi:cytochrome c peroxidase
MKRILSFLLPVVLLAAVTISCENSQKKAEKEAYIQDSIKAVALVNQANSMFGVIGDKMPGSENDTPELIALGDKLYHEVAMSGNNTESCNTCHMLDQGKYGVDNLPTSLGAKGKSGTRNSPTVLDAGFQIAQFWDGRAANLAEQAKGPVLNPIEMGMPSEKIVVKKIGNIPEYQELFAVAYPGQKNPVNYNNIVNAIAAFERTLVTHNRFDDFVKGDWQAMSAEERDGLETFINTGCIACHLTPTLGGHMYQKMGLVHAYSNTADLGRQEVTKNETDKFVFKVPMLRNVAETYPYYHDGSVASLDSAITKMAWLQLGKKFTPEETGSVKIFLAALTDESRK